MTNCKRQGITGEDDKKAFGRFGVNVSNVWGHLLWQQTNVYKKLTSDIFFISCSDF